MDKINVKPSKPASAAGIIVTIFLLIFGAGFLVLVGKVLSDNEAPVMLSVVFYLFMLAWFVTGFFILIYHVLNLKKKKGLPMFNIETEPGERFKCSFNLKMRQLYFSVQVF